MAPRDIPIDAADTIAATGDAFASTIPPPPDGDLAPGSRVERYVVLRTLGRGGMGVVYMAFDGELDRRVALKLLVSDVRDTDGSGGARQRLLREAQVMAKLSHPNVVTVFDVGTFGDQVFLAMEYVDGANLRVWRDDAPRAPREILASYLQAGRGLVAAHDAGIFHRDFKPENVIVDRSSRVRVLDFGLARVDPSAPFSGATLGAAATISGLALASHLTYAGTLIGTPAYMAPEQLRGEPADARSDQFAFSVALFEALYGARPHEGKVLRELLDAIENERVRAAPAGVNVPRGVRAALLRGLRAKPEDRFPSMRELLDALERATAAPRKTAVVMTAVVVAGAAFAFVAARPSRPAMCAGAEREIVPTWGDAQRGAIERAFAASGNPRATETWARIQPRLDAFAAGWGSMRVESCEATRVRGVQSDEALDLRTACLDQRRNELSATAALLATADAKLVDNAVNLVGALPDLGQCADVASLRAPYAQPHDPAQRLAVAAVGKELAHGTALVGARDFDQAATVLTAAAEHAKQASNRPLVAASLYQRARSEVSRGKDEQARRTLLEAANEASIARDDNVEAQAWILLVRTAGYSLGHYEESELYRQLAESAITRAGGSGPLRADLARYRADALYAQGKVDESLALYRDALALRQRAFGPDSPQAALAEADLADIALDQNRLGESRALYESALAKMVAAYGSGQPAVLIQRSNLAVFYLAIGAYDDAARSEREVLASARPEDMMHAIARLALARAVLSQGDVEGGMNEAREAFAEYARVFGDGSWHTASDYSQWAETLVRRHRIADALAAADKSIAGLGQGEQDRASLRAARDIRALCLARTRTAKAADALAEATRALAAEEKAASATSPKLLVPLLAIGEAEQDATRALAALERAFTIAETTEGSPEFHADVHLALARALVAAHADAPRARAMAERAAREYDAARLPELALAARATAVR